MADFVVKQGDRRATLRLRLLDAAGAPALVDGATSVTFSMRAAGGGALKVSKQPATVDTLDPSIVSYAWGAADTDTVGSYEGEVEVTWGPGITETFPTDEIASQQFLSIVVQEQIA